MTQIDLDNTKNLKRIADALEKANLISAIRLNKEHGIFINHKEGRARHPG